MAVSPVLNHWLNTHCESGNFTIKPLAGDASFRRYYRIQQPSSTLIAMDASLEKKSCVPFAAISRALQRQGLIVPEILASDFEQGFLLLTDLGDNLYLKELNLQNARPLYSSALNSLYNIQRCRDVDGWTLSPFTAEFMRNELNLFREWFLENHLKIDLSHHTQQMLSQCFDFLADTAATQPYVFMHRDYHSANLMRLPNDQVGVLDFQDAFMGPVTYDLVSLLRDCYVAWPEQFVLEMVQEYWQQLSLPNVSLPQFLRWFDLMGVQRHLKALLTFSRKHCRDNNSSYLQHVPRTLNYVVTVSQKYPELQGLNQFLNEKVIDKCAV